MGLLFDTIEYTRPLTTAAIPAMITPFPAKDLNFPDIVLVLLAVFFNDPFQQLFHIAFPSLYSIFAYFAIIFILFMMKLIIFLTMLTTTPIAADIALRIPEDSLSLARSFSGSFLTLSIPFSNSSSIALFFEKFNRRVLSAKVSS